ncbi:retropepsin-like aspartic protease [uncultured Rummeliibacillus sp.]|uniref:retropepsin-like aspartic protease n=1 Tax=uncultured Rummeliibacillus sp. TaxID=762292 RepID=UPI0026246AB1|nr:retropepsin-like aspartic protease [uncultured Rummeliibacillus sp.]
MKKLIIEDGLLLTDLKVIFRGKSLSLNRVLVDTGSGGTIISTDLAQSIDLIPEVDDTIYRISVVGGSEFVFSKMVDTIKIGEAEATDFPLEIGAMNYDFDLDGIVGLDLLKEMKANINLEKLTIEFS